MAKYSKKAEKAIEHKMHKMKGEDKPQKQKVAIALSEAREHGLKVPPEKKKGYHGHEGSSHEHLAKQDRRGANKAAATRTVKIQVNHERCSAEDHEPMKARKDPDYEKRIKHEEPKGKKEL